MMEDTIPSAVLETADMTPATSVDVPLVKLKGRQRLLQSLQRMSSSPSLVRSGRQMATYQHSSDNRASVSCVSLAQTTSPAPLSHGHSYGDSFSSTSSAGLSTAPTSIAGSLEPDMRFSEFKQRMRFSHDYRKGLAGPASAPIQLEHKLKSVDATIGTPPIAEILEDYFSMPFSQVEEVVDATEPRRAQLAFVQLPAEIKMQILRCLTPTEIVQCSAVSKDWHQMCFDGQLWTSLDTSDFYRSIPSQSLVNLMTAAGPFVRDLNLRGCVQMRERWVSDSQKISELCRNVEHLSIEGCRIDRSSVHYILLRNSRLVHLNLTGLSTVSNSAMKILAKSCPLLEHLNVSWCANVDTKGLQSVVRSCSRLKDLRAGEIKGFDDESFIIDLFRQNRLETLVIPHCLEFNDSSLRLLMHGRSPEFDILTSIANVPPRRFKCLDFSRCKSITASSVQLLAHHVPHLQGLQLGHCHSITDDALTPLFATTPRLTHLNLEELTQLTNASLLALAKAPCAARLSHLNLSYCEAIGDAGVLPLLGAAPALQSLDLDNTRISDLTLVEAAHLLSARNRAATTPNASRTPIVGLRLAAYDCANVTWTGVHEVLARNAEFTLRPHGDAGPRYPKHIIALKCYYGYQPLVEEHTRRVLAGELARAAILARKWSGFMVASEEVGAGEGMAASRRRRRRVRGAGQALGGEGVDGSVTVVGGAGGVVRRRARSGGCAMM